MRILTSKGSFDHFYYRWIHKKKKKKKKNQKNLWIRNFEQGIYLL